MYVGYFFAARGAMMQERRLDTLSNNLANVSTPGFKKDRYEFKQFLETEVTTDWTQGSLMQTERDLDIALSGKGYFKVMTPDGPGYTRNGVFHVSPEGTLKTGDGYDVLGEGGSAIDLGDDLGHVGIDSNGNISKNGYILGSLSIVDIVDQTHLKPIGNTILSWKGPGQPDEVPALETVVSQGYVEQSNVNVVSEMVQMIDAQRSFEAYTKSIKSFEDADKKAATQVGRLQ